MRKVLFITGKLQPYRVPILNLVAKEPDINLTVAHSSKRIANQNDLFEEVILSEKSIGPFTYHDTGFIEFCKSFDVVVSMFYLQKLSLMSLLFYRRYFKLIYWGIGVTASQKNKFDSPSLMNHIRFYISRKADAMIFYTDYVKIKYVKNGINSDKLFVMPNTVAVLQPPISNEKSCITFIGTLNKSKNIFELLYAYYNVLKSIPDLPNLEIVGSGEEYNNVQSWIKTYALEKKIILHGAIYDEFRKAEILSKSFINISPSQAGLSLLECFGYGVPFATSSEAITGGERLNIIDTETGFLLSDNNLMNELMKIIIMTVEKPDALLEMGLNAKNYYLTRRTPQHMANGFIDAVNFVLK
jgi:glycosyltransferase involved in cell wall biosynthesis